MFAAEDIAEHGPRCETVDYSNCFHQLLVTDGVTPKGRQRHKCLLCRRTFSEGVVRIEPGQLLIEMAKLYRRGYSMRQTYFALKCCKDAVREAYARFAEITMETSRKASAFHPARKRVRSQIQQKGDAALSL